MFDVLTPLRHIYGVEPTDALAGPGDAGYAETEALRQIRAVLDAHARHAPSDAVVAAVLARAAEPQAEIDLGADSPAEAALLDQTLDALHRLPRSGPSADVLAAVQAFAAEAAEAPGVIRHVYDDAPLPDGMAVEAEILRQSRTAIERAIVAQPRPRPSTAVVDAVLARAAEASGLEAEPALDVSSVEAAILAQSHQALDRLPHARPSAATLDAVRLAAVAAGRAGTQAGDAPRRAADRAPSRPERRTPVAAWAGAATFLVAALAAIVILPNGSPDELASVPAPAPVAAAVSDSPPPAPVVEEASEPEPMPTAPSGSLVASSAIAAFVPVTESREPASADVAPQTDEPAPSWEASDDVRALSLRLQDLDADDGLGWDEPAEAFGAPAARARTTPGLQVVRDGAPPAALSAPPPAAPDTTTVDQ